MIKWNYKVSLSLHNPPFQGTNYVKAKIVEFPLVKITN